MIESLENNINNNYKNNGKDGTRKSEKNCSLISRVILRRTQGKKLGKLKRPYTIPYIILNTKHQ